MWKLIFLIVIVWLIIHVVKRLLNNPLGTLPDKTPSTQSDRKHAENQGQAETMVQCCTCQIHLPRSEAFMVEGRFYCSHAHIQRKQS
ncbi:MAG: PP0621 family protein [Methylotenera sp.]